MLNASPVSAAPPSGGSASPGGRSPPIRRATVATEIADRFSDTIGWSPKGFHPELVGKPLSDEPDEMRHPNDVAHHDPRDSRFYDSNADLWKATLERAVKGIVSINYTVARSFDLMAAGTFSGTGFVVDKENGIILSNRHIVTPGPIAATARFNKHEELSLRPIYFDPVHDFGFFQYDPFKIKYAEIEEIELCPEAAKVGLEIKICGSDAGEHGSIWGGTLARLDRPAPYNTDFNTFYIQATSGTSAGSSGSPVLDIFGRAVALNVGGSAISSSSFYLPLDRVVRALRLLQKGKPVPRGTLQTEFIHVSYDLLKKLGLSDEIEMESRKRNDLSKGLLSVQMVLPEGPGSHGLQGGDVVIKCSHPAFGERYIHNFVSLWDIIDESVGENVTLTILRGQELKVVDVKVKDLHTTIPDTFLEVMQAIIHPVSYQIARLFYLPCRGLFVAASGISMIPSHCVISQIDNRDANSIDDLINILQSIPDGKRVSMRYRRLDRGIEAYDIFIIDKHFFPMALFKRNSNIWERQDLKLYPAIAMEPTTVLNMGGQITWKARLRNCLLKVYCRTPYPVQVLTPPL
jgi:S1-C subfamily serine protease